MKKIFLSMSGLLLFSTTYAQGGNTMNTIGLIGLTIAVIALAIAIYGLNRLLYLKKRLDAEISNQKDDLYLTIERLKDSYEPRNRNQPQRDRNRPQHNNNNNNNNNQPRANERSNEKPTERTNNRPPQHQRPRPVNQTNEASETQGVEINEENVQKPAPKKHYRRRPQYRKPSGEQQSSQNNNVSE